MTTRRIFVNTGIRLRQAASQTLPQEPFSTLNFSSTTECEVYLTYLWLTLYRVYGAAYRLPRMVWVINNAEGWWYTCRSHEESRLAS